MPLPPRSEWTVDEDPRVAETLPAWTFTSEAFLERELDTLFRAHWQFVPERPASELREDPRSLADLVRRRGSRAPVTLLDRPFFLQRDWDGRLHLFPNVCTHAWHTLVQGPGRERTITCPQHGRQFDCEGRVLGQPGFERGVDGFPRACDDLADLKAEEWGPFLFACMGEPAAPLAEVLAPVQESLGKLSLDALRRKPQAGEVRELDGNWKQHAWNYMDASHIPYLHRKPGGLADALEMSSYRTELHGHASLQWAYAKDPAHGFDEGILHPRFHSPGKRVFALWWLVFPNLTLNFYPWGLSVNVYAPVPDKPRRTLFLWYHYAWDEEKYARRDDVWMMREVDDEDVDAMTQVTRGVRSGFAPRGRFAGASEAGPHWLHRKVFQATGADAPAVGPA